MSTVIRLSRGGRIHNPVYRISVADSRKAPTAKFLDQIGYFDPNQHPPQIKINEESAINWLKSGAQPSDTVRAIFKKQGIYQKLKQVKAGTALSEASAKVTAWEEKPAKPNRKSLARTKAADDAKAAEVAATAKAAEEAAAAKAAELAAAAEATEATEAKAE